MKLSRTAVVVLTVLALAACKGDEVDVDVREGPTGMLADSAVLQAMRSTDSLGRIIYDAAPDLSLASAQQRRPDIFRAPTPAAKPAAAPTDTTKADAARRARTP